VLGNGISWSFFWGSQDEKDALKVLEQRSQPSSRSATFGTNCSSTWLNNALFTKVLFQFKLFVNFCFNWLNSGKHVERSKTVKQRNLAWREKAESFFDKRMYISNWQLKIELKCSDARLERSEKRPRRSDARVFCKRNKSIARKCDARNWSAKRVRNYKMERAVSFRLEKRHNCKFNPALEAELAVLLFPFLTAHSKNDKNDIIGKLLWFWNAFAILELTQIIDFYKTFFETIYYISFLFFILKIYKFISFFFINLFFALKNISFF